MTRKSLPKPRPIYAITMSIWAVLCTAAVVFNVAMHWWLAAGFWAFSAAVTWGYTVPTSIRTHRSRLAMWRRWAEVDERLTRIIGGAQ